MRLRFSLAGLCILLLTTQLQTGIHAQPPAQPDLQMAGRIVLTVGGVFIVRSTGERVAAVSREPVYAGDTLITDEDGSAQIRFIDRAIASLQCNSELHIASYQYEDSNSDNVDLHLKRGTVRTITGAIQRSNYQFRTDIATVRPNGTDFEVAVVSSSKAYFGVYDGSLNIRSMLGELDLGGDSQVYFGSADDLGPPLGLAEQPPAIGAGTIVPVQTSCL